MFDVVKPEAFLEAIERLYDREIEMEESEVFLAESEAKAELLLNNTRQEYNELREKINEAQNSLKELTSVQTTMLKKLIEEPNREELTKTKERLTELQIYAHKLGEEARKIETENRELKIKLEQTDKENEITKQENGSIENLKQEIILMEIVLKEISMNFPVELEMIINKVKNKIK